MVRAKQMGRNHSLNRAGTGRGRSLSTKGGAAGAFGKHGGGSSYMKQCGSQENPVFRLSQWNRGNGGGHGRKTARKVDGRELS